MLCIFGYTIGFFSYFIWFGWVYLCLIFAFAVMSIVLIYGAFDVKRLVVNNEREEAGALVVILLALLLIGFIIFALSLNMLNNYSGNLNYPPGVM